MREWLLPKTALLYENTQKKLIQDGQISSGYKLATWYREKKLIKDGQLHVP